MTTVARSRATARSVLTARVAAVALLTALVGVVLAPAPARATDSLPYATASDPVIEVVETHGDTTDGKPAEGDQVRYSVDIGYIDGFHGSFTPEAVGTWAFIDDGFRWTSSTFVTTTADMLAGEVTLPRAAIFWNGHIDGTPVSGTVATQPVTVPTEALDINPGDVTVTTSAINSSWTTLDPLDVEVGDRIVYTIDHGNAGNVTLNHATAKLTMGTTVAGDVTYPSLRLAPGTLASADGYELVMLSEVTAEDIARGYIDATVDYRIGPDGDHLTPLRTFTPRVVIRPLTPQVRVTVGGVLQDTNGDGLGQAGEQIAITTTVENTTPRANPITITGVAEGGNFSGVSGALTGRTVAAGDSTSVTELVTITDPMYAVSHVGYAAEVYYTGVIDGKSGHTGSSISPVAIGPFVAPEVTLDVSADYVDANGDGVPSIGETATFTATVTNEGAWPLTGLALAETHPLLAASLPADAAVAPGASVTWDVTHVLTAADFGAGAVAYGVTVDGVGLEQLADSASIEGIGFAAFESDLIAGAEGAIAVCSLEGEPLTKVVAGDAFRVHLGSCGGPDLGAGDIYFFSTPTLVGAAADALTVPAGLELGEHRVAAYGADGVLVGWASLWLVVPVETPVGGEGTGDTGDGDAAGSVDEDELAATGADLPFAALATAAAMMLLGFALLRSRRNG